METKGDLVEQVQQTIRQYQAELDRVRRELNELNVVIPQNSAEVDRLAQREMSIANRLREMEMNLEAYPRGDIRQFYLSAQETQLRLYMMRTQLEQQQNRQKALQERQKEIQGFLRLLEGLTEQLQLRTTAPGGKEVAEQEMIARVIQAQEDERLRLSQQIHDGPTQTMSNLVLQAEVCERFIDRDPQEAKAELASLKQTIHHTLQEMRRFIFDVRPMILDDLGLVPTLRRYIQDFSERSGIEVNLVVQGSEARMPPHIEISAFRLIQEALANVARHAHASQVRIALEQEGGNLTVTIEDNGVGFRLEDTEELLGKGHRRMGIISMRQRVEVLLKGQLTVESTPGRGTRVIATIPLPEPGAASE
ncbi:MAG: ATP-binding protein [Chloroflexia bacterium]